MRIFRSKSHRMMFEEKLNQALDSSLQTNQALCKKLKSMTNWEHECHGYVTFIKHLESDCECIIKRARNEGLSKSAAINFIAETMKHCSQIDDNSNRPTDE